MATASAPSARCRASVGQLENRLSYAINLAQSQIVNNKAAESRIRDANIAEESANLTRFNILNQSGIAALAQANQSTSAVLSLLRSLAPPALSGRPGRLRVRAADHRPQIGPLAARTAAVVSALAALSGQRGGLSEFAPRFSGPYEIGPLAARTAAVVSALAALSGQQGRPL